LERALPAIQFARIYRRVAAVLAVAEGTPISEVARRTHVARTSVERWVARYLRDRDVRALQDDTRGGRPRLAKPLTKAWLTRVLQRDPRTMGYQATTWTVALLACYCREHCAMPISARTLRRRLRESGFRWKRPRYRFSERAAHVAQKKGLSVAA
jgi:transposase